MAGWRSAAEPAGNSSTSKEENQRDPPFNFSQQPQQNHMTRLLQSPWCVHCNFGKESELLLYKFHLMPERPSVCKTGSPTPACKPPLPETREKGEKKNLINLQNARDLLIYYYNCSSAHDKFPALGASTRLVSAVSCVGT